ncbi:MAG: penicillin-binding protein 2 [bacterium]
MRKESAKSWQASFIFFIEILGLIALVSRLAYLQVFKFPQFKTAAEDQRKLFREISPKRGKIFVSDINNDFFSVAVNKKSFLFYIVPKEIKEKDDFIEKIAPILAVEERRADQELQMAMSRVEAQEKDDEKEKLVRLGNENLENIAGLKDEGGGGEKDENFFLEEAKKMLKRRLENMNDPYEAVSDNISEEAVEEIRGLKLAGVYFTSFYKRYYPEQEFAAEILGFMGYKDDKITGRYGVEESLNEELEGRSGSILGEKDSQGRLVAIGEKKLNPVQDGCDIYLTIDRNVQYKAQEILKEAAEEYKIKSGSVIVMDPKTGRILAMADWPTFNPNYYGRFDLEGLQNGAIQKLYEPGSILKIITVAAAMNENKISPNSIFEDKGFVEIGGKIIKNSDPKPQGVVSIVEVLEKSLNTGAIFAQQQIAEEIFLDYIRKFNLDKKTGVELLGEAVGNIRSLEERPYNAVNYASASFGQGVALTSLEISSAVCAIANKGMMMKPYIIEKIEKNGQKIITDPKETGQAVSPATALKIGAMMVNVVKNGSGSGAMVDGYNVAGKTGTAQIAEDGKYTDRSIHSFVGFAPLEDPVFSVFVRLDDPEGFRFSSATAAPTFGKIAKFLLEYYAIPPNN